MKRLYAALSTLALSITGLMIFSAPLAHAQSTDTWINTNCASGAGCSWSTASNWTNGVPVNGDVLIFDVSALTTGTRSGEGLTNDLTNFTAGGINFIGSNGGLNNSYTIGGNAFNLNGQISNTSNGTTAAQTVNVPVTLTGNSTIVNNGSGPLFFQSGANPALTNVTIGSFNLGITSSNTGNVAFGIGKPLAGTGTVTINNTGGTVYFSDPSPSFSGQVNIQNGLVTLDHDQALGTGTITINPSGSLSYQLLAKTGTIVNSISISHPGTASQAITVADNCIGNGGACTNDGTVTFSGLVSVNNSNATVLANAPVVFSNVANTGFTITAASGSLATVTGGSGSTGGVGSTGGSGSITTTAPKAPDTGAALTSSHYALPLLVSLSMASGIYIISRKVRTPASKKL
jgi:hypothetical protein